MDTSNLVKIALILAAAIAAVASQRYYGTHISKLSELHHGVSGDVFAVDSRTLFIKDFTYDGEGPAAYFYVGTSKAPTNKGAFRIRDERGSAGVLKRYNKKDITLTLPEGKTLRDIKWFSVWCDEFSVDFGNVMIPKNLDFPRPQKIGGLKGIHAVQSDNIVIVDAQTLLIPNFSYDGVAPDAKFWVGRGLKPSPAGIKISDENGKETPLKRYDRKTIVLTLPGDLTVFDIGHFGVWCEAFAVDFAHVRVPEKINVPPSLKMLGISPQSKLNCEVLHDDLAFEVRWAVAGESVVIQLVSKLDDNEYMSFGVSGNPQKSDMIGGDVVVAWVNRLTGKGYAQDYFLEAKSQCSGSHGSCPDTRLKDNSNSIRLLNAAIVNDYSIVTYQRPLKAADPYDQPIYVNRSQAIIWAVGPLNQRFEVSYHTQFLKKDKLIDFGRQPFWNCPIPENDGKPSFSELDSSPQRPQKLNQRVDTIKRPETTRPQTTRAPATPKPVANRDAWDIPPIQCNEPEDGVFYAQMGPTGGKHGYPAITGHVGWGISWYINGLLIPEVNVVRNKTYTFVIEGGNNPDTPANYHPFYITDDEVGGYEHKNDQEREKVKIFAGVHRSRNNKITPTGVGRICNWTPDINGPQADEYHSFGAYQRSLTLKCEEGEPGIITWTPDANTPDTVYYQCFTHRYLGWKINVVDSCDSKPAASSIEEVYADPEAEQSIRHETKLFPSENFLQQHEKDLIKHHNMNGATPKITAELQNSGDLNRLLKDGIRAAEELEHKLMKESKQNESAPVNNEGQEDEELIKAIAKIPANHSRQPQPNQQPHSNHQQQQPHPNQQPQHQNQRPLMRRPPQGPPPGHLQLPPGHPFLMKPPQSSNYPFYQPIKLPPRRPIAIERRPMNRPPSRPFLLPQQSMMVNTYKRPSPQFSVRNYMKSKVPPVPQKPMSPVLLLGEPTEIKPTYKKSSVSSVVIGKPSLTQISIAPELQKQINTEPRPRPQNVHEEKRPNKHQQGHEDPRPNKFVQGKDEQRPNKYQEETRRPVKYHSAKKNAEKLPPRSPFKDPFDIKTESPVALKEASNTGFKADTIIVESGFRPIFRREDVVARENGSDEEDDDRISHSIPSISRRSDDFDEDLLEADIPFTQPQSAYFEPMFIPSPQDSVALPLTNDTNDQEMVAEASEKQEFFYLPPNDAKRSAVSYDAKAILDTSLLNDPSPSENDFIKLSSKTKQFIKETPQFAPFTGEIPSELMLQISSTRLAQPVSKDKASPISTKLSAVKTNNGTR